MPAPSYGPPHYVLGGSLQQNAILRWNEQANQAISQQFRVTAVQTLRQAIVSEVAALSDSNMTHMLDALRLEAIPRSWRLDMNQKIGDYAAAALVQGYEQRKYKRPVASYRVGDRFSGGVLGAALRSPDQVRVTAFSVSIIDKELLDKAAKQWRRLNFGAGGGGIEGDMTTPGRFRVSGLGMVMGLPPDPRPAFKMPRGVWRPGTEPGEEAVPGTSGFHPTQRQLTFPTRGIAARNFLDSGIKAVAYSIRPGLDDLWDRVRSSQKRQQIVKAKTGGAFGGSFS